jgi:hypothetical protein
LIYVFFTEFTQQEAGKPSQAQRIKHVEKHRNLLGTPIVVLVQQQQIQRGRKRAAGNLGGGGCRVYARRWCHDSIRLRRRLGKQQ